MLIFNLLNLPFFIRFFPTETLCKALTRIRNASKYSCTDSGHKFSNAMRKISLLNWFLSGHFVLSHTCLLLVFFMLHFGALDLGLRRCCVEWQIDFTVRLFVFFFKGNYGLIWKRIFCGFLLERVVHNSDNLQEG